MRRRKSTWIERLPVRGPSARDVVGRNDVLASTTAHWSRMCEEPAKSPAMCRRGPHDENGYSKADGVLNGPHSHSLETSPPLNSLFGFGHLLQPPVPPAALLPPPRSRLIRGGASWLSSSFLKSIGITMTRYAPLLLSLASSALSLQRMSTLNRAREPN